MIVAISFTRTWSDGPAVSLNGIADRVADDRRGVGVGALAEHVAVVVLEVAGLDVLLGVVPRAAAVVEDGGEQDARDGADHQEAGHGLVPEEEADDDRREDGERCPGATISRSAARVVMSTTRA